mgnify:CR=1 FL=1
MPRRTYDPRNGRRRPDGPVDLASIRESMPRRQERTPEPTTGPGSDMHRPSCQDRQQARTFLGNRGDLMGRCLSCNTFIVLENRSNPT